APILATASDHGSQTGDPMTASSILAIVPDRGSQTGGQPWPHSHKRNVPAGPGRSFRIDLPALGTAGRQIDDACCCSAYFLAVLLVLLVLTAFTTLAAAGFLAAAFFAAGFLATFLAVVFLAAFLAAGFFAADFLAVAMVRLSSSSVGSGCPVKAWRNASTSKSLLVACLKFFT